MCGVLMCNAVNCVYRDRDRVTVYVQYDNGGLLRLFDLCTCWSIQLFKYVYRAALRATHSTRTVL